MLLRITIARKTYLITAECIFADQQFEHYRLSAGAKSIVMQCNRPMLVAKGLKSKRYDWKRVSGTVDMPYNLERVLQVLEMELRK